MQSTFYRHLRLFFIIFIFTYTIIHYSVLVYHIKSKLNTLTFAVIIVTKCEKVHDYFCKAVCMKDQLKIANFWSYLCIQHQISVDMLHTTVPAPSIPQNVSNERTWYGWGGNPRTPDLSAALIIWRQTGCQSREYIVWLYLRNSSSQPN